MRLLRWRAIRLRQAARAGGAVAVGAVTALWASKALGPPAARDRASWWHSRRYSTTYSKEAAAAEAAILRAFVEAGGTQFDELYASVRETWSGIEIAI
mmetsp:Transcript_11403/g.33403  ORF Transcript_11403/g.33403 Transcript_11403/m.33403 type:complete len:98 (-) Transcript_11403:18-311(-)